MTSLADYARARDERFAAIVQRLEDDARIRAAWLSGSHGRNEADEWSDFDLHVAVSDDAMDGILAEPGPLFSLGGEVLLVQANFPSDSMPDGRYWLVVYPGPTHVDWNIGPISAAARPHASRLLFQKDVVPLAEDPGIVDDEEVRAAVQRTLEFFWAMAPIAVKYAGRGWTASAVRQIDLLSRAFVPLWRWGHRRPARRPDTYDQNRPPDDELQAEWPDFQPRIDALEALRVIGRFCEAVAALHPRLVRLGAVVPDRMPQQLRVLISIAESEARQDVLKPGTGRQR